VLNDSAAAGEIAHGTTPRCGGRDPPLNGPDALHDLHTTCRAVARAVRVHITGHRRPITRLSEEDCILATASSTKLRPLGDRVVIKPTPREEMTKSGIVLPDTAKEKPQEGEILAVGPGKVLDDGSREAIDVSVGQKVLYAKYAGTEFKVEGDDLLIVSQKDILAIVED
jgi:chaperonin GroES